jgi:hypothetical protein
MIYLTSNSRPTFARKYPSVETAIIQAYERVGIPGEIWTATSHGRIYQFSLDSTPLMKAIREGEKALHDPEINRPCTREELRRETIQLKPERAFVSLRRLWGWVALGLAAWCAIFYALAYL